MRSILVLGAGKIGSLVAALLSSTDDYVVCLADRRPPDANELQGEVPSQHCRRTIIDVGDGAALNGLLSTGRFDAVISALPYYCNLPVAEAARRYGTHYFDLTEDTVVSAAIRRVARGAEQAFAPQCGLAPGFVSIAANDLAQGFDRLQRLALRVGALPLHPSNALKYSLTWSTDGLINEYGNPCQGIEQGRLLTLQPLEGYETVEIDGALYEAFNTSGGLGTLAESYAGRVRTLNYKTLRYPGHCEKMRLLLFDLELNDDRDTLRHILERAIPKSVQDVVVVYVSAIGYRGTELHERNYVRKLYPRMLAGRQWSAIQMATASAVCAMVELVLEAPGKYRGEVRQEQIPLIEFLANRFGAYFRPTGPTTEEESHVDPAAAAN